jgi:hypothetical protein
MAIQLADTLAHFRARRLRIVWDVFEFDRIFSYDRPRAQELFRACGSYLEDVREQCLSWLSVGSEIVLSAEQIALMESEHAPMMLRLRCELSSKPRLACAG